MRKFACDSSQTVCKGGGGGDGAFVVMDYQPVLGPTKHFAINLLIEFGRIREAAGGLLKSWPLKRMRGSELTGEHIGETC